MSGCHYPSPQDCEPRGTDIGHTLGSILNPLPSVCGRGCLCTRSRAFKRQKGSQALLAWCWDMESTCLWELKNVTMFPAYKQIFAISEAEKNQMRKCVTAAVRMLLNKTHGTPYFSLPKQKILTVYLKSASSFTQMFFGVHKPLVVFLRPNFFFNLYVPSHSLRHASWIEVIQINVLKT